MEWTQGTKVGDYLLERQLNPFGKWLAVNTVLGQRVVLTKLLWPQEGDRSRQAADRARSLSRLSHPAIVIPLAFQRIEQEAFWARPWIEGESLRQKMDQAHRLNWQELREYCRWVLPALDYVAREGLSHLQLKATNIIIQPNGAVSIVGFEAGALRGERPEYRENWPAGQLDLWDFAGILYEALAGPNASGPLRSLRPELPAGVAEMIDATLALPRSESKASPNVHDVWSAIDSNTVAPAPAKPAMIEDAEFSVYRPISAPAGEWKTLLAFAHPAQPRSPSDPDPVEEVERQARQILGDQASQYRRAGQESRQAIPEAGTLTFVPELDGAEFNPRHHSFQWLEPIHRAEFRFRLSAGEPELRRGRVTVFLGPVIVAEVAFSVRIGADASNARQAATSAQPYRKIFASYSHRDVQMVRMFEMVARALGEEYLRDVTNLRSGEVWTEGLQQMIRQADIFQLFWSSNSMRSPFVRQEWEYAMSLGRGNFIRPTYWESPMPEDPQAGLPPENLARLHFTSIGFTPEESKAPPVVTQAFPAPAFPIQAMPSYQPTIIAEAPRYSPPPPPQSRSSSSNGLKWAAGIAAVVLISLLSVGQFSRMRSQEVSVMASKGTPPPEPVSVKPPEVIAATPQPPVEKEDHVAVHVPTQAMPAPTHADPVPTAASPAPGPEPTDPREIQLLRQQYNHLNFRIASCETRLKQIEESLGAKRSDLRQMDAKAREQIKLGQAALRAQQIDLARQELEKAERAVEDLAKQLGL